jgi:hypothetical protein
MPTASFQPDALRELRECLGPKAAEVIPALQDLLAGYPEAKAFIENEAHRQWDKHFRQLHSLRTALEVAQRYFGFLPETQPTWRDDLDRLEEQVNAELVHFEFLFDFPDPRRRGRRRNEPRRWLANLVAYVLQWHDVPLTKTHGGGPFQTVLMRVIEAAEGAIPPQDLFPLAQETVDLFRAATPEQLDAIDPRLIGLMRLRRLKGLLD